ncbi:hypothetical protein KEM55_008355 [Ascosphaera atra]|nr:hypothetical protein KEM55_008355 [Ascosphaera atra]
MASFSPSHRDAAAGGATLYLHSPNTLHHVHSASAINQLRRSLSKSPSKPVHARPPNGNAGANEDTSRRTTHGTGHGKLFLLHPTTTSTSNHSNNISSSSTPSSPCPCQGDTATTTTTTARAHRSARAGSTSTSTLRRTASMQLFKVRNGLTLNSPNPTTATATTPATAPPQRHSRRVLSESRSQGNAGRVNGATCPVPHSRMR